MSDFSNKGLKPRIRCVLHLEKGAFKKRLKIIKNTRIGLAFLLSFESNETFLFLSETFRSDVAKQCGQQTKQAA